MLQSVCGDSHHQNPNSSSRHPSAPLPQLDARKFSSSYATLESAGFGGGGPKRRHQLFHFIQVLDNRELFSILDLCKVADWIIFHFDGKDCQQDNDDDDEDRKFSAKRQEEEEAENDWLRQLITCVYSQGLAGCGTVFTALNSFELNTHALKNRFERTFGFDINQGGGGEGGCGPAGKIRVLKNSGDASQLLAHLANTLSSAASAAGGLSLASGVRAAQTHLHRQRSFLLAERVSLAATTATANDEEKQQQQSRLQIEGVLRGTRYLHADVMGKRFHLSGWGDFEVERIEHEVSGVGDGDGELRVWRPSCSVNNADGIEFGDLRDGEQEVDLEEVRNLQEQDEDLDDFDDQDNDHDGDDDDEKMDDDENEAEQEDFEEDCESIGGDDDHEDDIAQLHAAPGKNNSQLKGNSKGTAADAKSVTTYAAARKGGGGGVESVTGCSRISSRAFSAEQVAKFRAARVESEFPDEVDTPMGFPARHRFARYRGLDNFNSTDWHDTEEDEEARAELENTCNDGGDGGVTFQFENFEASSRRMSKMIARVTQLVDQVEQEQQSAKSVSVRSISTVSAAYRLHRHAIRLGSRIRVVLRSDSPGLVEKVVRFHSANQCVGEQSNIDDEEEEVELAGMTGRPLIASTLLPHEHRITLAHFSMLRTTEAYHAHIAQLERDGPASQNDAQHVQLGDEAGRLDATETGDGGGDASDEKLPLSVEPIKSKDQMVFQVGFRRFMAQPIYSSKLGEKTLCLGGGGNGGGGARKKTQMHRFMPLGSHVMASAFAPLLYQPQSVLQFRVRRPAEQLEQSGENDEKPNDDNDDEEADEKCGWATGELVATGVVLPDHGQPIIKRILLSGDPFKINKRSAVIRYMFFNPDDIEYFKRVQLHSKYGRRGHIVNSIGTHGKMRAKFDRQLHSADVVLMPLYKRVYPRRVADMYAVPPPLPLVLAEQLQTEETQGMEGMGAMDVVFG